ncbi:MAG: T9SS type A sorting domain-containing protein, partial [Saprospiraceae bacterium]
DIQCSATTSVPPVQTEPNFIVYPNPVFNELTISSTIDFHSVHIFSAMGENLMSCLNTQSLDVHNLVPGLYFIQLMDAQNHTIFVSRFVKQ